MENVNNVNDLEWIDTEISRLENDRDRAISMVDEDVIEEEIEKLNRRRKTLLQEI